MKQLDLFFDPPPTKPVHIHGEVCTDDEIYDTVTIGDHRYGLRIELAQHAGQWMWGTCFHTPTSGSGYRVGPKWGRFAGSIHDATIKAVEEIRERARGHDGGERVIKLLGQIKPQLLGGA